MHLLLAELLHHLSIKGLLLSLDQEIQLKNCWVTQLQTYVGGITSFLAKPQKHTEAWTN